MPSFYLLLEHYFTGCSIPGHCLFFRSSDTLVWDEGYLYHWYSSDLSFLLLEVLFFFDVHGFSMVCLFIKLFFIYSSWNKLVFLDLRLGVFQWVWKIPQYYVIIYCLILILLSPSRVVIRQFLALLMLFSALDFFFIFFISFSFFLCWIFGTFLIYILGHSILSISILYLANLLYF
jgi:hypothetical protein